MSDPTGQRTVVEHHRSVEVQGEGGTTLGSRFDKSAWRGIIVPVGDLLPPVFLFGAGHVGRAAAKLFADLPVALTLWDARADVLPACWTGPAPVRGDWRPLVDQAPSGSAFVVFTHSHDLDYAITAAALSHADAAYVGLIGSATKRARFEKRWAEDGLTKPQMDRLVCPIGGTSLTSKEPAMIALALAHEVMRLLERQYEH